MREHNQVGGRPLFRWFFWYVDVFEQFFPSQFQIFTSAKTLLKIARVESGWILELIGVKKRIHWKYLNDCIKIWLFFCRPKCWTCKENLGWAPKGTIESVGGAQGRRRREGQSRGFFTFTGKWKWLQLCLYCCFRGIFVSAWRGLEAASTPQ